MEIKLIKKWRAIAKWICNLAFILLTVLIGDNNGQGIRKCKWVWIKIFFQKFWLKLMEPQIIYVNWLRGRLNWLTDTRKDLIASYTGEEQWYHWVLGTSETRNWVLSINYADDLCKLFSFPDSHTAPSTWFDAWLRQRQSFTWSSHSRLHKWPRVFPGPLIKK